MSEMTCPACGSKVTDGLLCVACMARLKSSLRELPSLLRELGVNITRQSRYGSGGGNGSRARKETPLPFDFAAADQSWAIRNTLLTWVRELDLGDLWFIEQGCWCEPYAACQGSRKVPLPDDPAAWCVWLLARAERIRAHEDAAMILDEIGYCRDAAKRAIDRPRGTLYCGQCVTCGADLLARPGATEVACRRCEDAGLVSVPVNVADAWGAMCEKVWAMRLPRRQAVAAAEGLFGVQVKDATLRTWIVRKRIIESGGRLLVSELVELARA